MSTCSCARSDHGYDQPEFHQVRQRRAKKRYLCEECGCWIRPGELHRYVVGKWDGDLYTARQCLGCSRAWDHYEDLGCCLQYGMMWFEVENIIYCDEQAILDTLPESVREEVQALPKTYLQEWLR